MLYKHPKHYLAVDCVIFGYQDGELKLLIYPRSFEPAKGSWSLPGGFVQESESAEKAARRVLKKTTGLEDIFMEEVAVFSEPDREELARIVSVAYYALVRTDDYHLKQLKHFGAEWCPIVDLPKLIFDHADMVQSALLKLQQKASFDLVGAALLPELFTLTELRCLYEAIFQREFDPGNFRKKILSLGLLKKSDKKDPKGSKKGAFLYAYSENKEEEISKERIVKL